MILILTDDEHLGAHHHVVPDSNVRWNMAIHTNSGIIANLYRETGSEIRSMFNIHVAPNGVKELLASLSSTFLGKTTEE